MSETGDEVEIGPCSYCGEEHELEPEHVVPRAIFVSDNQSTIVIRLPSLQQREKRRRG